MLIFEVRMQIRFKDRNKTIQLVEEKFEHGQVRVKESRHVESIKQLDHSFECSLFIFEDHEQKACDKVHTLAVLDLFVIVCVRL